MAKLSTHNRRKAWIASFMKKVLLMATATIGLSSMRAAILYLTCVVRLRKLNFLRNFFETIFTQLESRGGVKERERKRQRETDRQRER